MSTTKNDKFILVDVVSNNNKFWNISMDANGTVVTSWGRVGDSGQSKTFPNAGDSFYASKCREKTKKGYEPLQVLEGSSSASAMPSKVVHSSRLADVAASQIVTNSPVTMKLVKFLAEQNVHNIMEATGGQMKYDSSRGTFQTPLGIVTQSALDEARSILVDMGDYVLKSDYDNRDFSKLVSKYLMRVPQNIGRGKPDLRVMYPNVTALQSQNQLLDQLEGSLKLAMTDPDTGEVEEAPAPKVFDAALHHVEDGKVIDKIRKLYKSTLHSGHACSHLDVKEVYGVEIGEMARAFDTVGSKMGNVMDLWHGTNAGNLLSILKNGFLMPRDTPGHITGAMFGPGIYYSSQSTKSLNYAYGYWSGQRNKECFMFLNQVAMGNYQVPSGPTSRLPGAGYHSYWAQAGKSGVQNHEMIIFNRAQANPTYLIKFG